jgi:hypothetical protein
MIDRRRNPMGLNYLDVEKMFNYPYEHTDDGCEEYIINPCTVESIRIPNTYENRQHVEIEDDYWKVESGFDT